MYKKLKKITIASFVLGSVPLITYGQEGIADSVSSLANTIGNIVTFMRTLLLSLAAIFIIVAGYKYMTAAGDAEQVKDAKRMIAYTVVAIVLAIIATGVVPLTESILGA